MSATQPARPKTRRRRGRVFLFFRFLIALIVLFWMAAAFYIMMLRWVYPPITAVQFQRRIQAVIQHKPYQQHRVNEPLARISNDLQRAVVAAEDARFYKHHGFDWREIRNALDEDPDRKVRGASTITQQLIKNLFFGTSRSYIRKGVEATLVPVAEFTLGKRRILELYRNVVEWGPGVFGAEAAAHYHYSTAAAKINREQSLRLAAILPNPIRRRPDRMTRYSTIIDERMRQMGW